MNVRKPGELSDTEKNNLKIELRAGCRNMGVNSVYVSVSHRVRIYNRAAFGLCRDCGHFEFAASQYKVKWAACGQHENFTIALSEREPVVECSSYYKSGEQDAHDYSKNAWLLDPPEKKMGII